MFNFNSNYQAFVSEIYFIYLKTMTFKKLFNYFILLETQYIYQLCGMSNKI